MSEFTDIHHHFVYGIDDGPRDFKEMAAMLHAAHREGCRAIIATPHVVPGVKSFDERLFLSRLKEAQDYCDARGLAIKLYPGAEVLYTPMLFNQAQVQRIPTLAGTRHVLVEFSPGVGFVDLAKGLEMLLQAGYQPVLAHTERYRCLMLAPWKLTRLKKTTELLCQVNASTIVHPQSAVVRHSLNHLLTHRHIDIIASDAHNATSLPCNMAAAEIKLTEIVGKECAREMMDITPRRLLKLAT